MAPRTWDDASKFRLLLAVIAVLNPSPPDWQEVASKMGDGYTKEAVRQAYQKIKKSVDTELGSGSGEGAASTPRKRGTKGANGTPKSTGKGARPRKQTEMADSDDEETLPSPTKKRKAETTDDDEDGILTSLKKEQMEDDFDFGEADEFNGIV